MQQYNLPKYFEGYSVLRDKCNLYKISNLAPNTRYHLSFSDLVTLFLSDKNGELYFNNNKEPLPMQCIPYVVTLLTKADDGTFPVNPDPIGGPIGHYSKDNCDSCDYTKSRNMFLTLYDGKKFENVEFIISGGAIGLRFVPNTVEYYNENRFSGVGIL
jgi:hypothetical protein